MSFNKRRFQTDLVVILATVAGALLIYNPVAADDAATSQSNNTPNKHIVSTNSASTNSASTSRDGYSSFILTNTFSEILSQALAAPQNPYTDDLIVEHDDTLEGDVAVFSGDVTIEEGGEILGNLIVLSGDIDIEAGGRVKGDVINVSGDVDVAGKILGNLSVLSGDVDLYDNGLIEGDLSVLSGEVDQSDRSQINGELKEGPKIDLPFFSSLGQEIVSEIEAEIDKELSAEISAELDRERNQDTRRSGRNESGAAESEQAWMERGDNSSPNFIEQLFHFVLRLIGGTVGIVIIAGGAGLLTRAKPAYVESVAQRLQKAKVANFAIGLLFNMVAGLFAMLFIVSFCLAPVGLIFAGLLLVVNGIGWTAASSLVGRRLTGYANSPVPSIATVVLGAIALTTPIALLWATGSSCLSAIGFLATLMLMSVSAGSVLTPWLKRLSGSNVPAGQLSG